MNPPAPDPHPREEAMLPCPFCDNPSVELDGCSVECRVCGAMGPDDTRRGSDPVTSWNRRTPAPAVADGVSDTELLDWLESNHHKVSRGPLCWYVKDDAGRYATFRDAALSALRTGGPGK